MNRLTQQRANGHRSPRPSRRTLGIAATITSLAASLVGSHASEPAPHHANLYPGGVNPQPVITSATGDKQSIKVDWQSFGRQTHNGSNVVYQLLKCPALKGTNTAWTAVASATNVTSMTAPIDGEIGFLTLQQDPAPSYAGAEKCSVCHYDSHGSWLTTRHANALQTLKNIKQDKNSACLACHTVGYGTPNGYVDEATTPHLAGVQCESCHGPADGHVTRLLDHNNQVDRTRIPLKTLAAEMCGGCHTDAHHPTYDEWATSGHGSLEIPEEEFASPETGPARMATCGACHSGATRLALLNGTLKGKAPVMPTTEEAAGTAITCAVCHAVHEKTENPAQLRFPLHSEMPYSYTTATNFTANYNPQVQTCAQCHNMRGATWKGTSRPPHHSPQYNLLIGNGGYDAGITNVPQSAHMKIENQCAQCHTHPHAPDEITEQTPQYTGHEFKPTMQACAPCHDEVGGALLTEAVQSNVKKQIAEIKGLLDEWATTKAPEALRQKYGALAWEFQNIGQLSKRTPQVPTGPTAAEQNTVPDNIKQARYNLYLVEHDASYGVHNGNYARFLLKVARDKVKAEL